VQFHPESIATEYGHEMLANFMRIAGLRSKNGLSMAVFPDPAQPMSIEDARACFGAMLDGAGTDEEIAAFLLAPPSAARQAEEIAGAAQAMRERMIRVTAPDNAIDVCGTGGDGQHTLNVSTAVALVVAACGVPVAKHGNRAASSKAGGADTLEALGVNLTIAPERWPRRNAPRPWHLLSVRAEPSPGAEAHWPHSQGSGQAHDLQPARPARQPGGRKAPAARHRARIMSRSMPKLCAAGHRAAQ
jgi:hypothetical protein